MRISLTIDGMDELLVKMDTLITEVTALKQEVTTSNQREEQQMADFAVEMENLTSQVEQNGDAAASIISLVEGLAQQVHDNAGDPDAVRALADEIKSHTQAMTDAVFANTPVGPSPETPPVEPPPPEPPAEG